MADPTVFCVRCAANVSALPPAARFCNRCGVALSAQFHLAQSVRPPALPPLPAGPYQPTLILVAYAQALFNLGRRYETAIGSQRNLDEAARCYWKAARLGDPAALYRVPAPPAADIPPMATIYPPPVG